ncbi:MAG: ATPase domain-containing protein [Syntrophomonadaceae bacterium]
MLLKSGIDGFDALLYGGVIENSIILVEGVPGAGKTTFGMEFIYKGIVEQNEPGVVITFEELPEQLYHDASNYGWDLRKLEEQNMLRIICTSPEVVLDNTMSFLRDTVKEIGAKRLLLDSVTQFNMEIDSAGNLRRSVYSLCSGLKRMGLTSLLIKEVADYSSNKATFEEFLVDTVIRLYFEESFRTRKRLIEVLKSRGQDFVSGKYPFKFGKNGLEIIGIVETQKLPDKTCFSLTDRLKTGIEGLDNIVGGGFLKNTTILVEGASGTGKTVMGIHYLLEGLKQGEKGFLLATEESADFITQYFRSFNTTNGIATYDQLIIMDRISSTMSIEEVIADVISRVKTDSIQRVVIDFINTLAEFSDNYLSLKTTVRNLIIHLNAMGCTTLLILNEEQAGVSFPLKGIIQPLVQGEIYLSYSMRNGKRYRFLEVNKMKGQSYIAGKHLAEIGSDGMSVFQRFGGI